MRRALEQDPAISLPHTHFVLFACRYIAVVNIVLLLLTLIVTAINGQWVSLVLVLLQLGLSIFLYYAAVKRIANWLLVYLGAQLVLLLILLITGCAESGGSALVICLVIAMFSGCGGKRGRVSLRKKSVLPLLLCSFDALLLGGGVLVLHAAEGRGGSAQDEEHCQPGGMR